MRQFSLAVWGFALLLGILVSVAPLVAYVNTPSGWEYSGALSVPDGFRVDYNSHIAKMWQGSRGEFDYKILFTHEEHIGVPTLQGFYVVVGAVAGLLRLDLRIAYHLLKAILAVVMVMALWRLIIKFFDETYDRWIALVFATLMGGWGWMLFIVAPNLTQSSSPIEFWLIDAFNLFGAMYMPHFTAAIILQIMAFLIYEHWRHNPNLRPIVWLSLVLFVDAIIQPYIVLLTVPLFVLLTAYYIFIDKTLSIKQAVWLIIPALAHGGIVVYQYLAVASDPIWSSFTTQNQTLSPHPLLYLFAYLPFLILIPFGAKAIWQNLQQDKKWLFPILWIVLVVLLLYAPFPTQRRYLLGVQTFLAILAACGWMYGLAPLMPVYFARLLIIPYVALGMIVPLLLLVGNITAGLNLEDNPAIFYSADEVTAYDWVRSETPVDALFFISFNPDLRGSGGALVGQTGRRVFMGHWIETADYTGKIQQLLQFYDETTSDEWRQNLLEDIGATYLWYDDEAREIGNWNPDDADYLQSVFERETVIIYEVQE